MYNANPTPNYYPSFQRVRSTRDTLNNSSARPNFLCVELQSTDLFRPSLARLDERASIESAAVKGGAASFVLSLPNGYDTMLGRSFDEDGQDISAGQWQRLASARAYFREASILVLDEPTAALDAKAEVEVYKRFRDMSEGKSVLLISHRLGSARLADRIVFLDDGRIAEQGTHDELIAMKGAYAKLYSIQADWYR